MITNRIPAGLLDKGTEFFTVIEGETRKAKCLHGGKAHSFQDTPSCRKAILLKDMKANPAKEKAMVTMVGVEEGEKLEKYTMCNYGALNDDADIDENGVLSQPEYVPCSQRGICPQEGIGCSNIMVNGVPLSNRETDVFKLVNFKNDEIAEKLFRSVETVKNHLQNIRAKTGMEDKDEMIHWATKKGII